MKVLIFTAIQGRQHITDLFLMGIKRLQMFPENNPNTFELFCVASDQEDIEFLKERGIKHCVFPNRPLSNKLDYGFKQALKLKFDYMLRIGSDDLLDHNIFPDHYNDLMAAGVDWFGLKTIGVTNFDTLDSIIYRYSQNKKETYLLGGGSMLSRKLCLKFANKPLYNVLSLNRGLDLASETELIKYATPVVVNTAKPMLVDVKTKQNIHPFVFVSRRMQTISFRELTHFISIEEEDYLLSNPPSKLKQKKIVGVTGVWKRPEIFEIFARNIKKLDIHIIVAGSEGDVSRKMVEAHGFEYIESPNTPLATKMNAPVKRARELKADYVLFMGSDDLLSPEAWQIYLKQAYLGTDFVGLTDFYFYDTVTKKFSYWGGYIDQRRKGHTCGAFRMLSARLLNMMGWEPFKVKDSAVLDNSMQQELAKINHTSGVFSLKQRGVYGLDVKSSTNMTPFALWPNTGYIDGKELKKEFQL